MSELVEHVVRNQAYGDDLVQQYVEAGESRMSLYAAQQNRSDDRVILRRSTIWWG